MKLLIAPILLTPILLISTLLNYNIAYGNISGSKSSYQYNPQQKLTPTPQNYHPFYIYYIGRHGSRYISKAKPETITSQILEKAHQQNQLTPLGKNLREQLNKIIELNQNKYGQLTDLGKGDIQHIAQRMLKQYPTIFQQKEIAIMSTTSQRTIDSAEAFLKPFRAIYPNAKIIQQPENEQVLLRFFDYSPAYKKYKTSQPIKNAIQTLQEAPLTKKAVQHVIERLFNSSFINQLNDETNLKSVDQVTTTEFVIALFKIYQETLSFSNEKLEQNQINLGDLFTFTEKRWLSTVITAKNYLQIGPAFDENGIQIRIAAPLLRDIILSSDNDIHHNQIDANLHFAHAETISPLATLMEIKGTNKTTDFIENYHKYWQAERIIPMAANIQLIFYRNRDNSKPILVKLLLNEREMKLPIQTNHYPYYDWSLFKKLYLTKLDNLGLTPKKNAKDWLIHLN